jgi:flavodoxin I
MKVLMVYATNSGSTYTVSTIIKAELERTGHEVTLQKAVDTNPQDFSKYDMLMLGSPSWKVKGLEGQIQETMQELLDKSHGMIPKGQRFAVYGCGDPDFTMFCMAVDTMNEFLTKEGGMQVHEPLKIDGFYFHVEPNSSKAHSWAAALAKKL